LNIIFGNNEIEKLRDKYIVLELDTVTIKSSKPITAYCVIENLPIDEMPRVDNFKKIHAELMENYRNRNWDFCIQAIEQLMGYWGKQIDSFYTVLLTRVAEYKQNEPDENWTGVIPKN
jgi:hypothetical protein